ncbi:hypothetical protein [Streptomyces sp. NPDC007100]
MSGRTPTGGHTAPAGRSRVPAGWTRTAARKTSCTALAWTYYEAVKKLG